MPPSTGFAFPMSGEAECSGRERRKATHEKKPRASSCQSCFHAFPVMSRKEEPVGKTDKPLEDLGQYSRWMSSFGQRIRKARLATQLTQKGVPRRLPGFAGEGQAYISKIERDRTNLTAKTMVQLAATVGMGPDDPAFPIPPRSAPAKP